MSSKKKRKSQKRYWEIVNDQIKFYPITHWQNPKFNPRLKEYGVGIDPIPIPHYIQNMISEDELMSGYIKQSSENYFKLSQEDVRKRIEEIINKNKSEFPVYKNGMAIISNERMHLAMNAEAFDKMMTEGIKEYIDKNNKEEKP